MPELSKVLVANRGEIAARIFRTCHAMGLGTVAVFSDADAGAPHVRLADEAVRLGPAPSAQSYLALERVLEAARRTGADAIHPGYGFLAENADFAEACEAAGIVFVGPSPTAIRAMGSKREARRRVASQAHVPVVPGYDGEAQDLDTLKREALALGFPVLVKASAGGGGKGMQVVSDPANLEAALVSARRIAESAFGDGTLLIERYVECPRHVEIQILGDHHGHLVHLFERECSIQRRHQKILEETPSTALDDALRHRMGEAAIAAARTIGYTNAGTVEFILAPDGAFYFLEVNTRLQVEHPITEALTGVDLVREQLRIARGEPLAFGQDDLPRRGAALECRLYAEDPAEGFLPSTGRLVDWHLPAQEGLRVDSGVEEGTVVDIHYDPMLAKLVTWGADRDEARARMSRALRSLSVQGVKTNRELLRAIVDHPAFAAGDTDTHFIERHMADGRVARLSPQGRRELLVATVLADHERRRRADPGPLPELPTGYRNNPSAGQVVTYRLEQQNVEVGYRNLDGRRFVARVEGWTGEVALEAVSPDGRTLTLELDGLRRHVRVVADGARHYAQSLAGALAVEELPRFPEPSSEHHAGSHRSPMPGAVIAIPVAEGQRVARGDVLVVMEAMKMEQSIRATEDGVVSRILVSLGEQVEPEQPLLVLDPAGEG
jgi:acetyl-CoA carboxylase biotin carboxylase subunit